MKRGILCGVGLVLAMAAGGRCLADELVKVDGTKIEGRVVEQDPTAVTMELNYEGLLIRQKVARRDIKTLTQEVREGPGYCVLPLEGEVGVEITADSLSAAIKMARRDGAKIIILRVNSNGGEVSEMADIVRVIAHESKDLRFVAYVDKGFSAAAIISLACPEIYMPSQGVIGASVPFHIGANGIPEDIEQKFMAAAASEMRNGAEVGHHPVVFVNGMCDIAVELVLRQVNGKPVVVEAPVGKEATGDEVIKGSGRILSMTASEAERYGLSVGTTEKVDDLREKLGLKAWFHAGTGAEAYLENSGKARRDGIAVRENQMLGDTVESCEEKRKEIAAKITQLNKDYSADQDAVKADYDKAMDAPHKPSELQKYKDMAVADAKRRLTDLDTAYNSKITDLQSQLLAVMAIENVLKKAQMQSGQK